jgi:hypothetical protein
MVAKPTPARELAARALCRHDGHKEEAQWGAVIAWETYLPAADAVLEAIGWQESENIPVYRTREVKSEE